MTIADLAIQPGIVTDLSEIEVGKVRVWSDADKVRFINGKPETIGGWVLATGGVQGMCRGLCDWVTLAALRLLAVGTHKKVHIYSQAGTLYDIGPRRRQLTLGNNPFATTSGSAVVVVTDTGHGAIVGDTVIYSGASAVAGLTLNGTFEVTEVVNANSYKIAAASNANATTSGGGAAVAASYWINVGTADTVLASGYGAGSYGSGAWNAPRASTGKVDARTWSFAKWGEDLIMNPAGGGIYLWDASVGFGTPATIIANAPATAVYVFMTDENRQIVALGAHDGSNPDPMLVRWCEAEDYTIWTPTATNTAGDKRLDTGNYLVCAASAADGYIIFSDQALWRMNFDPSTPGEFSWSKAIPHAGIAGPNAATSAYGAVFWMGLDNFMVYRGTAEIIPCPVRSRVFGDINTDQMVKVYCGLNEAYGEIWWFYPSAGSLEVDRYVALNVKDGTWTIGSMPRTAFLGDSKAFAWPMGAGPDGNIYYHETGKTANGAALNPVIESGDLQIADGAQIMHVSRVIPDFVAINGSASFTLKGKKYPGTEDAVRTKGPFTVSASTKTFSPRMRARQVAIRIESTDVGDSWRLGMLRFDMRPDGGR